MGSSTTHSGGMPLEIWAAEMRQKPVMHTWYFQGQPGLYHIQAWPNFRNTVSYRANSNVRRIYQPPLKHVTLEPTHLVNWARLKWIFHYVSVLNSHIWHIWQSLFFFMKNVFIFISHEFYHLSMQGKWKKRATLIQHPPLTFLSFFYWGMKNIIFNSRPWSDESCQT